MNIELLSDLLANCCDKRRLEIDKSALLCRSCGFERKIFNNYIFANHNLTHNKFKNENYEKNTRNRYQSMSYAKKYQKR